MSLTTRTIQALNNGVSRQPAILRSQDQTEAELNTWGQIATGVSRRPPTRLVAQLGDQAFDGAMVHHINRDITERHLVIIKQGSIRVFDEETGVEETVTIAPGSEAYLDQPGVSYRAVTVADYTFIVNTSKVPAFTAPPTTPPTVDPVNPGGTGQPHSPYYAYKTGEE